MGDLPKKSIRITDLTRLDTTTKIDNKQELLFPVASNQAEKDTFSMPVNTFVTWLLLKHCADRNLSNLSDIGQAIIDAKQDYFNKVPDNTDLNTFTQDGIWKVKLTGGTDCHAPGSGVGYFVVSVDTDENGLVEQQTRNLNASSGDVYHRQRINGTWTAWGLITQDMSSPSFVNAPTVSIPGTNDDQLATVGQLNGKFKDIFQAEWFITEGVLMSGEPSYTAGVFRLPFNSVYYTNDSIKVELSQNSDENIASNVKRYVFADETGDIKVWENFEKVVAFPLVMGQNTLYYNIYTDQYADSNGYYSLCPLGLVDNGVYTKSNTIQFLNLDNLKATLDALNVSSKVDIEIGTEIQNSRISSDTQYERQMSAGHYVSDGEGGWDLDFGAGVLTQSHSEDENVEGQYNKDVLATLYAEDDGVRTEINVTPSGGATLTSPDTDNIPEKIATAKDIRELETTSLTFKGYVATSAPSSSTYALMKGDLWINSSTMPTSFPVAASSIKKWNGSSWVNYGTTYTVKNFDFFRNINDNEGYYWFGGQWVVMSTDMSTDYFTLNQTTGKWEIKSAVNLPGKPTAGADATASNGLVRKGQMDSAFAALATVATSGSYNDLSNKPTIGNATIIIKQGGAEKGRFTTNQTSNAEIDLERGGSLIDIDNNTITENSSDELQAIGTINKNTAAGATQYVYDWIGTAAEYAAQNIESAHPEWLCFITDDEDDNTSIYTQSEMNNLLATKADVNLSNIESDAKNISNWSSNVTNCITEIPQDIVITNPSNVLTVNAGSKVYLGDGTVVNVSRNITYPAQTWENKYLVAVSATGTNVLVSVLSNCVSAASNPGTANSIWFNTTDNKCYKNNSAGTATECSMPVGIASSTSSGWTSIDQVFNGFGYIGSSVFILPGIRALAPDGINADGTLKNILCQTSSVQVLKNFVSNVGYTVGIRQNGTGTSFFGVQYSQEKYPGNSYKCWYKPSENKIYNTQSGEGTEIVDRCAVLFYFNNVTNTFRTKETFHIFDYSELKSITKHSLPSNTYINLSTNISSGYTYKAPADGYLSIVKAGVSGDWLYLRDNGSGLNIGIQYSGSLNGRLFIPVSINHDISINWSGSGAITELRFIYANGAL